MSHYPRRGTPGGNGALSRTTGSRGGPSKECQTHCFSTLNHNLGYCYNDARVIKWILLQARRSFQGVTGSFKE